MPSLNEIMCSNTTLCIVENPSVSRQARVVINGFCNGRRFTFDFVSNDFQVVPVRFHPSPMNATEVQSRNTSIALFQNQALLDELNDMDFSLGVEQDAIILDDGSLHDLRRGQDSVHSPDRTTSPTPTAPPRRHFVGYFHTHPHSRSMRPPTPSADWNEVPGVGFPGAGSVLHFMIEGNKRIWALSQNRRAFIVGVIRGTRLFTIDQRSNGYSACWVLS